MSAHGLHRNQRGRARTRRGGPVDLDRRRGDGVVPACRSPGTPRPASAVVVVTTTSESKPGCCTHTDASPRSSTIQIGCGVGRGVRTRPRPARRAAASTSIRRCIHHISVDGVDVVRAELVEQPLDRPAAERVDDRLEVLAGRREVVLVAPAGGRRPRLDHALALEVPQPLDQQRAGDAGQAPGDVVEAGVAEHQLAQDQRRPAVGEHLAGQGRPGRTVRSRACGASSRRLARRGSPESVPARSRSWTRDGGAGCRTVAAMTTTDGAPITDRTLDRPGRRGRRRARRATPPATTATAPSSPRPTTPCATPGCSRSAVPERARRPGRHHPRGGHGPARAGPPLRLDRAGHVDAPARRALHGVALPPRPARRRGHAAAGRRRGHRAGVHRRRRLHPPAGRGRRRSTAATGSRAARSSPASRRSAP